MALLSEEAFSNHITFLEDAVRRTDERYANVQAGLSEAHSALDNAKRTILALSTEEGTLRAARLALMDDLQSQRLALEAMRQRPMAVRVQRIMANLPREILQMVFLEAYSCVEEVWADDVDWGVSYTHPDHPAVPFTLSAVNRLWRDVALRTPEIWCFIGIPESVATAGPVLLSYAQIVLSRSKHLPLDIFLGWTRCHWDTSDFYRQILDALAQHTNRWRKVTITFPEATPVDALQFLRLPMPRIEDLAVTRHSLEADMFPPTPETSGILPFCAGLRRYYNNCIFSVPRTPMAKMIYLHLTIGESPISEVWNFLEFVPSLEFLRLEILPPSNDGVGVPLGRRVLPHLRHLGLTGYAERFHVWAAALDMPQLRELAFSNSDRLPFFSALFDNVAATVESLTICYTTPLIPFVAEYMVDIQRLHQLRHIIFQSAEFVGPDLPALFSARAASGLPRLESIKFDDPRLDEHEAVHLSGLMLSLCTEPRGPVAFSLVAKAENVPDWLLRQYRYLTGGARDAQDAPAEAEVHPAPMVDAVLEDDEEEEAQFTDGGSGSSYTSDSEWEGNDSV